jgi:predicted MFS family arabinose efflux permease
MLLGFASYSILTPVLPLLILSLGGDATMVGIVVALQSIPSVGLRPLIGRLADEWSLRGVLLLGTSGLAASSALYLVPSLAFMALVRLLHGTAWAAFNTGGYTGLAGLAPPARRAEASAIFNLMPNIATMVMPAVGLFLATAAGLGAPIVVAALLGTLTVGTATLAALPAAERSPSAARRKRGLASLIERSAVLPMTLEFLWRSVNTLFVVFPPLFATAKGFPVTDLLVYYPTVGIVLIIGRLTLGSRLDGFSRTVPLIGGAILGAVAMLLASVADTALLLTLAASVYAVGASGFSPVTTAMAIDRSSPERRGAAMATYSVGFQLSVGLGAAVWGTVISVLGFPAPFLLGLLPMAGIVGLTFASKDV